MSEDISVKINEMLNYFSNVDCLDLDWKWFEICKVDDETWLPLVIFEKKTYRYYFLETTCDMREDNWSLNLEWIMYLYEQPQHQIVFVYEDKTYCATYCMFDLKTSKKFYKKKADLQYYVRLWTILYQEWFFFFDYQRQHDEYKEFIFDWSILDKLVNECDEYLQKSSTTKLLKAKDVYSYITKNYTYAWYMTKPRDQDSFYELATNDPSAFFLPVILKKRECVCQSYSQLFTLLCFYYNWYDFKVDSIISDHKNSTINHIRNIFYYEEEDKYYFVDITIKIFKKITKKEYDHYYDNELYTWLTSS